MLKLKCMEARACSQGPILFLKKEEVKEKRYLDAATGLLKIFVLNWKRNKKMVSSSWCNITFEPTSVLIQYIYTEKLHTQNPKYLVKTKLKNPESAFWIQHNCFITLYIASNALKVWSFSCLLT